MDKIKGGLQGGIEGIITQHKEDREIWFPIELSITPTKLREVYDGPPIMAPVVPFQT